MITLSTPIAAIKGVPTRLTLKLAKMHIKTVHDLLWHFPARYEDYTNIVPIAELEAGETATVHGVIQNVDVRRTFRKHMVIVEAEIMDESGSVVAVWFNQPYIARMLPIGRMVSFAGKIAYAEDRMYISNPSYELIHGAETQTKHTGGLIPIYPETKGLTSKGIRYLTKPILGGLSVLPDFIPQDVLKLAGLHDLTTALRAIHFPNTLDDVTAAKKRFAFEDLFLLQLNNIKTRIELAKEKAPALTATQETQNEMITRLPFTLTPSQKTSLAEIVDDIAKTRPMNRLLQGDVGSGKTVIAALAAMIAAKNGHQTAFMAPTEVLAQQHYKTLARIFGHLQVPIGLLTSSGVRVFFGDGLENTIKKDELKEQVRRGEVKIVVGTHALIQKSVEMQSLGLAIVDEQHRFGVKARAALLGEKQGLSPHFLSMSATPIPRTLTLTIFGDLDLSLITELPEGRHAIITKIVSPENRNKAYTFIAEQIKKGRQAFVVCPRIEKVEVVQSGEKQLLLWNEAKAVKAEYEKLSQKIFPNLNIAMLHGKMKPKEKSAVMAEFVAGKINILVSTSVIEVGVDIPNATIMVIEGAEHFGLAQLYQFRGRVGRGAHQSFCLLFSESATKNTQKRLNSLIEAKNGFELAEKDLAIRGPGQFFGESQTGLPDLAMEALTNIELVRLARNAAVEVVKADQEFKKYPLLKDRFASFQKKIHLE